MSEQIILTGAILALLFAVPMLLRTLGYKDEEVATWLKVVILVPALIGLLMVFFGLIANVWGY